MRGERRTVRDFMTSRLMPTAKVAGADERQGFRLLITYLQSFLQSVHCNTPSFPKVCLPFSVLFNTFPIRSFTHFLLFFTFFIFFHFIFLSHSILKKHFTHLFSTSIIGVWSISSIKDHNKSEICTSVFIFCAPFPFSSLAIIFFISTPIQALS